MRGLRRGLWWRLWSEGGLLVPCEPPRGTCKQGQILCVIYLPKNVNTEARAYGLKKWYQAQWDNEYNENENMLKLAFLFFVTLGLL